MEGTILQGTRGFGLRHSRSIGEAKTHLQHIFSRQCSQTGSLCCRLLTLDGPPSIQLASSFVRVHDVLGSLHSPLPGRLVTGG
jgi:hypothetical protein